MTTKVFVSWSGESSRQVAVALSAWLPEVLHVVEPFMSENDFDKGAWWSEQLRGALTKASYGIVCVTPESKTAPWLMFEAGSLAGRIDGVNVSPLLVGLGPADITGPLTSLQMTKFERTDVLRLVKSINLAGSVTVAEKVLEKSFDRLWDELADTISAVQFDQAAQGEQPRSTDSMIEEILLAVRRGERESRYRNVVDDIGRMSRVLVDPTLRVRARAGDGDATSIPAVIEEFLPGRQVIVQGVPGSPDVFDVAVIPDLTIREWKLLSRHLIETVAESVESPPRAS